MVIRSLKVTNFRNYDKFNITLGSKMNIFIGNNASGKTNILEAIAILGLTKSFRNGLDSDVIKFGKKKSIIEGRVLNNKQLKDLKIEFMEKDKTIFVNNKKIQKYASYISNLNIILFTPNDLDIIKYACYYDECEVEEGAIFRVLDIKGNVVEDIVSLSNGFANIELGYGSYQVKQIKGLTNYTFSDPFNFKIVDEITDHKKELYNYFIDEDIPDTKVDVSFWDLLFSVFASIFAIFN